MGKKDKPSSVKKGKAASGKGEDLWTGVKGWKQVEVDDALLLGADEYGFCGLEELDATALGEAGAENWLSGSGASVTFHATLTHVLHCCR